MQLPHRGTEFLRVILMSEQVKISVRHEKPAVALRHRRHDNDKAFGLG
jgi:hypothetical protein